MLNVTVKAKKTWKLRNLEGNFKLISLKNLEIKKLLTCKVVKLQFDKKTYGLDNKISYHQKLFSSKNTFEVGLTHLFNNDRQFFTLNFISNLKYTKNCVLLRTLKKFQKKTCGQTVF